MTADTRILGTPLGAGAVINGPALVADLPESIAGYTLVSAIGQGGMGCVYEARHNRLGKHFALKLLSDSLRDNAEAIDRFQCETLALGKLDHPNIVMASDAGVWQGRPFLVTELLKGQDLSSRVAEAGKLDTESVIAIAIQLSDALGFAHEHGYFHRDIKPSNVFLQPDGTAKLLDFGLVRSESNHALTQAGCLMGTVDFIAPEQACNASQANAASDIYSFGCTLVYLLSGELPFPNCRYPSLASKLHAHLHDLPSWFEQAKDEHPIWLVNLILAMVAKKPCERPANCRIVHSSLMNRGFVGSHSIVTESATSKRNLTAKQRLAIGSAIAIAVAAGTWTLLGTSDTREKLTHVGADSEADSESIKSSTTTPAATSSAVQSEVKTLPVSVTHNARGTSLPTLKSGKNSPEPKVLLSKDRTYD